MAILSNCESEMMSFSARLFTAQIFTIPLIQATV